MDKYIGKRLDARYEVHELVGVGGMSLVYRAYDVIEAKNVAIKILKDGIPFEVSNPKPNRDLIEAIEEGERILAEIKSGKRKGYDNTQDLIKSLNDE